jgi:hypothetical protein
LPSSIAAGDLIVVVIGGGSTGNSYTWPGSWVENADFEITTGETQGMTSAYLWASGGETSVTVTSAAGTRTTHCAVRISGAENPSTQVPNIAEVSGGGSPECDPPNLTPTGGAKDYLYIASAGSANGGSFTAAPTDYSNLQTVNSGGTTSSHTATGMAERSLNAASDNPGAFTHDDASTRDWCAVTIAVHPTSGTPAATFPGWEQSRGGWW